MHVTRMAERSPDEAPVEPGESVYDDSGSVIGRVSAITDAGFEVEPADQSEGEAEEEIPGKEFGEGYLMWRCTECGEMGELDDGLPDSCPNCGAPEEALAATRED